MCLTHPTGRGLSATDSHIRGAACDDRATVLGCEITRSFCTLMCSAADEAAWRFEPRPKVSNSCGPSWPAGRLHNGLPPRCSQMLQQSSTSVHQFVLVHLDIMIALLFFFLAVCACEHRRPSTQRSLIGVFLEYRYETATTETTRADPVARAASALVSSPAPGKPCQVAEQSCRPA